MLQPPYTINSFPATDRMFQLSGFHCFTEGGAIITHLLNEYSMSGSNDRVCKQMHIQNNAIIKNSTAYKIKTVWSDVTKWSVSPGSGIGLCQLLGVDGRHQLHLSILIQSLW